MTYGKQRILKAPECLLSYEPLTTVECDMTTEFKAEHRYPQNRWKNKYFGLWSKELLTYRCL